MRYRLESYNGYPFGETSVIIFLGSRLETIYDYLLAQASYSRFSQFSHSGQADSAITGRFKRTMVLYNILPAPAAVKLLQYCFFVP